MIGTAPLLLLCLSVQLLPQIVSSWDDYIVYVVMASSSNTNQVLDKLKGTITF